MNFPQQQQKMAETENIKLIYLVKAKPMLWDTTLRLADRKELFTKQWSEVANDINLSVSSARKRWKGMRDHYRHEIRRIQQGLIAKTRYRYFHYMEFLRPIFDPECRVPFPPKQIAEDGSYAEISVNAVLPVSSSASPAYEQSFNYVDLKEMPFEIIDSDDDDSFECDIISEDFFLQTPKTTNNSQVESSATSIQIAAKKFKFVDDNPQSICTTTATSSPVPPRRHISPQGVSTPQTSTATKTTPASISATTTTTPTPQLDRKDDSDYNFLISMLPHMKSLSDMGNLKFRLEVSKILMDIRHSELNTNKMVETQTRDTNHTSSGVLEFKCESNTKNVNGTQELSPKSIQEILDMNYEIKIENEPILN